MFLYYENKIFVFQRFLGLTFSCNKDQFRRPFYCSKSQVKEVSKKRVLFPDSELSLEIPKVFGVVEIKGDTTSSVIIVDTTRLDFKNNSTSLTLSKIHDRSLIIDDYYNLQVDAFSRAINHEINEQGVYYLGKKKFYWLLLEGEVSKICVGYFTDEYVLYSFLINVPEKIVFQREVCYFLKLIDTLEI